MVLGIFDASLFPAELSRILGDTPLAEAAVGDVKQYVRAEATGGIWLPKVLRYLMHGAYHF